MLAGVQAAHACSLSVSLSSSPLPPLDQAESRLDAPSHGPAGHWLLLLPDAAGAASAARAADASAVHGAWRGGSHSWSNGCRRRPAGGTALPADAAGGSGGGGRDGGGDSGYDSDRIIGRSMPGGCCRARGAGAESESSLRCVMHYLFTSERRGWKAERNKGTFKWSGVLVPN